MSLEEGSRGSSGYRNGECNLDDRSREKCKDVKEKEAMDHRIQGMQFSVCVLCCVCVYVCVFIKFTGVTLVNKMIDFKWTFL